MSTSWSTTTCLRRCLDSSLPLRLQCRYSSTSSLWRPLDRRRTDDLKRMNHLTPTSITPLRRLRASHTRRWFTASSPAQHGHLTPPKPGEEYTYSFPPALFLILFLYLILLTLSSDSKSPSSTSLLNGIPLPLPPATTSSTLHNPST